MLSVIIATLDSERRLVQTLAALVPGATAGLVSEVLIADGGSRDETAMVADVAGCRWLREHGSLGARLKSAAAAARAPWLLFLRPGTVLDGPWIGETGRFIAHPPAGASAAVFSHDAAQDTAFERLRRLLIVAAGGGPRPEQGLLLSRQFYVDLGGHSEEAAHPEAELLRRIGRRHTARLATKAYQG
jgi:hypothetical protein